MNCIAIATMLSLSGTAGTQAAITPASSDGVKHFLDCFGALFSNPPEHTANCSPGNAGPETTITSPGGATPPVVFVCVGAGNEPIRLRPGQIVLVAQIQQDCLIP
jgi:hypothetical protein